MATVSGLCEECAKHGIIKAADIVHHKITLDERKKLTMTGVSEVLRFDDTAVALSTTLGDLTVYGQQLQLKKREIKRNNFKCREYPCI